MNATSLLRCCAISAIFPLLSSLSHGLGFRIADQNAEATARGNAFVATADDPSAIYYNPAGITQLEGTRTLLGAYVITLKDTVHLDADVKNNRFSTSNTEPQAVPTSFYTWSFKGHPIALGLGVYAPYGFAIEYPDDSPIRTIARYGSIQYLTVNPVVAWKINGSLSIAAGATVNYGRAELKRGLFTVGDEFQFKGDGVAYGFNAGILWKPHPMHSFGATYRSGTNLTFSGHTTVNTEKMQVPTPFGPVTVPAVDYREDADATFQLPQNVTAGYSFRPTPDWNFEFNIDWTDWDSLNTVIIHQQRSPDAPVPFNWESSFIYEFGVTKKFAKGYSASLGYMYSENSVPNESFSPGIPDSNRHVFSAGFGRKLDRLNWYVAYQYAYGPTRTIAQNTIADGQYRFDSHALTLSLGYNF